MMKRFEIITESDARTLELGSTVMLVAGGHITPLARDTLRERRITVVRDDEVSEQESALAPVMPVRKVAIGSDHTGIAMKRDLTANLRAKGITVHDLGTHDSVSVDYPDVAARVARAVAVLEADAGIIIDGAGIGSAIAANKIDGVRAVMCPDETIARYSREHNGANVLCLGALLLTTDQAIAIVHVWMETAMREPRHIRRLAKIRALEQNRR
jgi:ribose 5-phosphate isomerase B